MIFLHNLLNRRLKTSTGHLRNMCFKVTGFARIFCLGFVRYYNTEQPLARQIPYLIEGTCKIRSAISWRQGRIILLEKQGFIVKSCLDTLTKWIKKIWNRDHISNLRQDLPLSLRILCGFFYLPQSYEHWRAVRWSLQFIVLIKDD